MSKPGPLNEPVNIGSGPDSVAMPRADLKQRRRAVPDKRSESQAVALAAGPGSYAAMLIACVPVACNLLANYFQASVAIPALASAAIGIVYVLLTQSVANLTLVCFSYFTFGTYGIGLEVPGANVANFIFIVACFKYAMLQDSGGGMPLAQSRLRPILVAWAVYLLIRGISLIRAESVDWPSVVAATAHNVFLVFAAFRMAREAPRSAEQTLKHCLVIAVLFVAIGSTKGMQLAAEDARFTEIRLSLAWGPAGIGNLAGLVFTIVWLLLDYEKKLLGRMALIVGLGLAGMALLLSFTRTAAIGMVCAVTLATVIGRRYFNVWRVVALIAAVGMFVPTKYFERLVQLRETPDEILYADEYSRFGMAWAPVVYAWENNPLFGVGFRKYMEEHGGVTTFQAHNNFTEEFAETGFVGLVALLFLVASIGRVFWHVDSSSEVGGRWHLPLRGAVIFWLVSGTQGSLCLESATGGLVMVLIGYAAALNRTENPVWNMAAARRRTRKHRGDRQTKTAAAAV